MIWRQYRSIEPNEFILAFADTSAGGNDYNAVQFLSKTKLDVPLVYHTRGTAVDVTTSIFPVLEQIFDITQVQPVVCYEVNNGAITELTRLQHLNRLNKYIIYKTKSFGKEINDNSERIGWNTNSATRPRMLSQLKDAIDNRLIHIYDKPTINELFSFIINKSGKPMAESNAHDDLIMALAGVYQMYQTEEPRKKITTGGVPYQSRPFGVSSLDAYR